MSVEKTVFGNMPDGREVKKYTISNEEGVSVGIIALGATLNSIEMYDKDDNFADILLGFDTVEDYLKLSDYQGATVGPYANRIGGGAFSIDGIKYDVIKNEKDITCLHSGGELSFALWDSIITDTSSVEFSYESKDGVNGFPGNLKVKVVFSLSEENELRIEYSAVSDKKTVINLTNHAYFNLSGYNGGSVLDNILTINADSYTPVDAFSIPTGEIAAVEGTPFDFRSGKPIGQDIDAENQQLVFTGGFDHNFCITGADGTLRECAHVLDPKSGRILKVATTEPGVQLYAGNFLKGTTGKNGEPMNKRSGFCLETQHFPDSPNKPDFPSTVYESGKKYNSVTVYSFGVSE